MQRVQVDGTDRVEPNSQLVEWPHSLLSASLHACDQHYRDRFSF